MRNEELGRRFLTTLSLIFFMFTPFFLAAYDRSLDLQLQISSLPEAKLRISRSYIFPFLTGSGPLTRDNNLAAVLGAELSPVSLNQTAELIWTPAAFFLLSGGGLIGSGWNMPLGNGIGLNVPEDENATRTVDTPRKSRIDGQAFDGFMWNAWGAGTFQFDLGAVIPGDWTHVLFQTRQELRYAAYSRAEQSEFWVFEGDYAENQNGWNYYASYVLGYSMPLAPVLDTVALMAEVDKSLYNSPGGDIWGEGLGRWIFSGIANFTLHPRVSTALIIQMQTRRNFGTKNRYDYDHYYRDLILENDDGKRHIHFYRAALILSYKIQ